MSRVVIIDHQSGAKDDLAKIAAALQRQDREHFAPAYGLGPMTIVAATTLGPDDMAIGLFKDADQPGALGYHDRAPNGQPFAKVFPLLDAQDGANLSTTISHELLELRADPFLTRCVQSQSDGKFWAYEVCDAVEQDEYVIDGVKVSNFVLPDYFEPPSQLAGVKLDYLGLCKKPFEVRPGGYMQWSTGKGWHQIVHQEKKPRAYRVRTTSRAGKIMSRPVPEVQP